MNTASTFEQELGSVGKIMGPSESMENSFLFHWWCMMWDINSPQLTRTNHDRGFEERNYYQPRYNQNIPIVPNQGSNHPHRTNNEYNHQQQMPQKIIPPQIPQQNPNVRTNAPFIPPEKSMGDIGFPNRPITQHGNSPIHIPPTLQNQPMPMQQNPQHMKQTQGGRQIMINNPGQSYPHGRYYTNQMMNPINNVPSPVASLNHGSPTTVPSPGGYSPMSMQSTPTRNSPQEQPGNVSQPSNKRSFSKESKNKTGKSVITKKNRSKSADEGQVVIQKPSSQESFGHRSPPLTPNQESQFPQQTYQGNYPVWNNIKTHPNLDSPMYGYSPQPEYSIPESQNTFNSGGMNHRTSYNNGMEDLSSSGTRKRKASVITEELLDQPNDILEITPDDSYLNEVQGRDQSFILSNPSNSADILANFESETKNTNNYNLYEWKAFHCGEEIGNKIVCCSFNNTGQLLATGTSKMSIYVWDIGTGAIKIKLNHERSNSTGLCFSPNPDRSNILASCSLDGVIRIWDCDSSYGNNKDQCIRQFKSKERGAIHSVDIHPTKHNLICSSETSGYLRFWDMDQDLDITDCINAVKGAATKQARFSPSGTRLATGESSTVKVFDVETLKLLHVLKGHAKPIHSVYWGDNDNTLISASEDSVRVWKLGQSSAECCGNFSPPGNKNYYAIPHPQYMNSQAIIGTYKSIYVWDYSQRMNHHYEIKAHDGIVSSLSSYGPSLLASTSHDSYVKLWSLSS